MASIIPNSLKLSQLIKQIKLPEKNSHKGQNGRLLIIGGSSLLHSASIWSAQAASHFVDLVHYCSTFQNQHIFINLKSKFTNGIIINRNNLLDYVSEDDCILIGPGMIRDALPKQPKNLKFNQILNIKNEALYTFYLVKYLLSHYPEKKYVLDAGALQMLDYQDLLKLKQKPILTPQINEYKRVFGIDLSNSTANNVKQELLNTAKKWNCNILLKKTNDYITDGNRLIMIRGGNPGLTKGGSGDVLSGITAGFYAKNDPILSMVLSSFLIKTAAEKLAFTHGIFYNIEDLVSKIPISANELIFGNRIDQ